MWKYFENISADLNIKKLKGNEVKKTYLTPGQKEKSFFSIENEEQKKFKKKEVR